jgi:pimeloyl-ACP methyl ester carboxylesterase
MSEVTPRPRRFSLPERGGEMAALEFGPADRPVDVVFSHANGFNAATYRTLLSPLAGELRILAPDLRGHGASTLPADEAGWPGWTGYAADLVALLAAAAEGPVVLAGHSLGATASLLAAAAAPGQVRSLLMFEPVLLGAEARGAPAWDKPLTVGALRRRDTFPDREAALANYRGRGVFTHWSEEQLADYVGAAFRDVVLESGEPAVTLICRPRWEALAYALHDYDPQVLGQVRCPVRAFACEDRSTFAPEVRDLAVRFGAQVEVVPKTTHFLPMERPDLVRRTLLEAVLV